MGDWVLVDRRNLSLKSGNNRSLTQKWIGPYKVIEVVSRHAYKLEYAKGIRIHNFIHTSLLKPFKSRNNDEMQVSDDKEDLFFEVENIIDSKRFGRMIKYRVRWKGYDETDDMWEPFENIKQVMALIRVFHHSKPTTPYHPTMHENDYDNV